MDRGNAGRARGGKLLEGTEPWYRRPDVWFVAAAIVLPFGWIPAVCRIAWVYATERRVARVLQRDNR